ncbi:MAG: HAD family hydrolase [Candidatus Eremiobacteraeota bacterium]|nr:HAD family hydrolase [Candidatus Eremiobacteraeota bacterium]
MAGIGFDFDHTLGIDNKLERIAFLRLLERVLTDGGRALGTLAEESDRIDEILVRQRAGSWSISVAVLRFVSERGVAPDGTYVDAYVEMCLEMVDDVVVPLPGAREMLAALRARGTPVALLTNGWNPLQTAKARRVGFEGPILASADIGFQKPDARAFAALASALDLPRERVWYVGDDPAIDSAGALAAGLRSVWLDAEGRAYPTDLPAPTRRITELTELLEL